MKVVFTAIVMSLFIWVHSGSISAAESPAHIPGDLNYDGTVNDLDYNILQANYGIRNCGNVADINGDCMVNILDFGILHENFGRSNVPEDSSTRVPVIEGWWLLPGVLAGVGIFARRRKG